MAFHDRAETMASPTDSIDSETRLAAARYHLQTRVLPVQRHDVMGRLSVLRMALLVARRRADAPRADDPEALSASGLAKLDEHVKDATEELKRLRWWDRPGLHVDPAGAVIDDATRPLASILALRGHRLDMQTRDSADGRDEELASPATQLAILGIALQMSDSVDGRWSWRLQQVPGGLRCEGIRQEEREGARDAMPPGHGDRLLMWMADELAAAAQCTPLRWGTGWELRWPASRQG